MTPLSVVIITYNEEKNIERCLQSVQQIADEVVVVDSFSSDATPKICAQFGVKLIQEKWLGYSAQKNLGNEHTTHNWILSLDADEALSETLLQSILQWKNNEQDLPASFNRLTNYCGHWIKHSGWYPDTQYRLFDKRSSHWTGYIHEKLLFPPGQNVIRLKGDCLHYSYYSVAEHYVRNEKYSRMSAEDLFRKGKHASWIKIITRAGFRFFKHYILQAGFLDGKAGFIIAKVSAYAVFMKYKLLRELNIAAAKQ